MIPLFRNCKISMDTYAKNLLKLVCCFGFFFSVLLFLLTAATAVPQTLIQKNMEESADILCENPRIYYMVPGVDGSQNHLYADAITLNIAYHLKDGSPLESVIWARYYTSASDVNESLRESVQGRLPANTEYMRYWHGSAAFVRFLHIFFNIRQIYFFHALLMLGLLSWLVSWLVRSNMATEAVCLVFSLSMVSSWFVPFCLEYTWTFLCMLSAAVIGLYLAAGGREQYLGLMFLGTGMATAFLDFLSTETITLLIPLLLVLRALRGRKGSSEYVGAVNAWKLSLQSGTLWSVGFVSMWASKWLLASAVLDVDVMSFVSRHIDERIGGGNSELSMWEYMAGAVTRNLKCLLPVDYGILGAGVLLACIVIFVFIPVCLNLLRIRNQIDLKMVILYLLVSLIPIIRFMVLHNHSWYHRSFTYRALAGSILAVVFALLEIVDWQIDRNMFK